MNETPANEKLRDVDQVTEGMVEAKIFGLLATRRQGATICPSEVARALITDGGLWRELMPKVRQVAQGLAQADRLTVTRAGVQVDATSLGGPIRLGRAAVSPTPPAPSPPPA